MLTLAIYCLSEDYQPEYIQAVEENGKVWDKVTNFNMYSEPHNFSDYLSKCIDKYPELENLENNNSVYEFTLFSTVQNMDTRAELVSFIYEYLTNKFDEEVLKDNFIIKFYIITPEGESFLVNDFNKIGSHIDYINSSSEEKILNKFDQYTIKKDEIEKNVPNPPSYYINKEDIKLQDLNKNIYDWIIGNYMGYILSKVMNKNIDSNKKEFQEKMIDDIVESRKEEYGDEIKTELDLVNKVMVQNDINMNNSKVISCSYNGEDISIDDISSKLYSHTFPAYITQVDIRDTLDDEYDIVTSKGTIHRSKGGKISILN